MGKDSSKQPGRMTKYIQDKIAPYKKDLSSVTKSMGLPQSKAQLGQDWNKFTSQVTHIGDTAVQDIKTVGSDWANYGNPIGLLYNDYEGSKAAIDDLGNDLSGLLDDAGSSISTAVVVGVLVVGYLIYSNRDSIESGFKSIYDSASSAVSGVASTVEKAAPYAPLMLL